MLLLLHTYATERVKGHRKHTLVNSSRKKAHNHAIRAIRVDSRMYLRQYVRTMHNSGRWIKFMACILACLCMFHTGATANTQQHVRTFFLEGVRSGRLHGPFTFQTGTSIQLETGTFRLDVLSAAGSFILTEQRSGAVFGVYELVPGRIIDAGYQLFTITRIAAQPLPPGQAPMHPPATPGLHAGTSHTPPVVAFPHSPYRVGVIIDLIHQIAYDWTLDGVNGESARYIERRGATLSLSRGIITLTAGLLADASWQETMWDPLGRFEQGTLSSGNGWKTGLSLLVPVFADGRWSASIGGGVEYQRETFDLEYGRWEIINGAPPAVTNGVFNGETNGDMLDEEDPIATERFVRQSQSAILSETILNVTVRLDYTAPNWFAFAGLYAVPWSETDLQGAIQIDDQRIPLSLERRHPFSGYAGVGFTYQDVHSYVEIEAGGINAIRLGVMLSF